MDSPGSESPMSSDGEERDAASVLDRPPNAMSAGGVVPAAAAAPANASAIMPCVALMPASGAANRKALCQAPTPRPKRTFTKSRLAVQGAERAPPTPEASSSDSGLQLLKSLGFTTNSNPGARSSSPQESQAQPESVKDFQPIQIDDDDPESEDTDFGTKRKLTSAVWKDFKKVKVLGSVRAQCLHCHKQLGGNSSNRTTHLHDHLKICTLKKIKMTRQNKSLAQSALRFNSEEGGQVSVGNYTFDPAVARRELASMIILHEYPLSMVDHTGFRGL